MDFTLKIQKSIQTCLDFVDIPESKKFKNKIKSKSQEELRGNDDFEEQIVQIIQDLTSCPDLDRDNAVRSKLLKKLRKFTKAERSERVNVKFASTRKDQLYSEINLKHFTRELSNELISKIKRHNVLIDNTPSSVNRADLHLFRTNHENNCVDEIIKEWLINIPIKTIDYLGRDINKEYLLNSIAYKVRTLIINKLIYNNDFRMKADIIEIIDDIPIDIDGHKKRLYLAKLVSELIRKIKDIFNPSHSRRKCRKEFLCKLIQPTEKKLKQFVREEITELIRNFRLKICPVTLTQIEVELTDILKGSVEDIRHGNIGDVKEEILIMLAHFITIPEHQALYFTNNVIYDFKNIFDQSNCFSKSKSQTFIVLQNSIQNSKPRTSINNTDISIEGISEGDIDVYINLYTNQIVEQINEWSANIKGFNEIDPGLRHVVINDLAGDIVDRHKYLEINPSSRNTSNDELEHLKYQIFKWINKVVGKDNFDTIEHASELMERIKSVPVPMLTKPQHNGKAKNCKECSDSVMAPVDSKPEAIQSPSKVITQNIKQTSLGGISTPENFGSKNSAYSQPGEDEVGSSQNETTESIQSTSKVIAQNKRKSSPRGKPIPENLGSKNSACPHQPGEDGVGSTQNKTTERNFGASIGLTSTPIKSAPSDPSIIHTQMRQPQGLSLSTQPKARVPIPGRISDETGFSSGPIRRSLSQERKTLKTEYIRQSNPKVNFCNNTSIKEVLESQSVNQLNDEYDEFVKNWVQQIPVATSNPKEQTLAEKLRLGIYNGIWKAITKLKMDPAILSNPFYYQDVFDDELDELLSCLPQTSELMKKKQMLKAQLIEKTTKTNELIIAAVAPSSYKQQLVENVTNKLPRNIIDYAGKDLTKLYEEMQKMNLAEDFILYIKYRDDNRVKANVFKKKLMKEVQELINSIKTNHGKELKDIDAEAYIDEVITALQKVPMPSEDTIRAEADEIYVGLEIEQWFSDLPLIPNSNYAEKLGRRQFIDTLAKKIHNLEKQSNLADSEGQIRQEVTRFLQRMPLRPSETENIDFMVEELVNRLKSRPNDIVAVGGVKRGVASFMDAYGYDDFSRDMPVCSSFSDLGRPAQAEQSSYSVVDGTRVKDNYPYRRNVRHRDPTPESQQQWYSLEESVAPPGLAQGLKQGPSCCQRQPVGQTALPQIQTSNQLRKTTTSSSQTPAPALMVDYPVMPKQSISDSPRQSEQASQSFGHSSQQLEQDPQMSRLNPETGTNQLAKPDSKTREACCKSQCSSPPTYKTEGTLRPVAAQTPDFETHTKIKSTNTTMPSPHSCAEPIGFSTPQQTMPPPMPLIPIKKTREVEKSKRDAAKKRLYLEDTENDSDEELRCRCMRKSLMCRRKKPFCSTCDKNNYVPCFMPFSPHPYFY